MFQFNILASHLARGKQKSASHQIILFTEKTISQFPFSLNSQYDHPYNDEEMRCAIIHWPIRSFERKFYPMKLSCLLGDTSIESVDLIRLKLWSLCVYEIERDLTTRLFKRTADVKQNVFLSCLYLRQFCFSEWLYPAQTARLSSFTASDDRGLRLYDLTGKQLCGEYLNILPKIY